MTPELQQAIDGALAASYEAGFAAGEQQARDDAATRLANFTLPASEAELHARLLEGYELARLLIPWFNEHDSRLPKLREITTVLGGG